MMQGKGNMEDFLRKRLSNIENSFQDDWSIFEQKLERTLYLQRMRRALMAGGFVVLLIGIFIGVNTYHILDRDFYQPRTESVNLKDIESQQGEIKIPDYSEVLAVTGADGVIETDAGTSLNNVNSNKILSAASTISTAENNGASLASSALPSNQAEESAVAAVTSQSNTSIDAANSLELPEPETFSQGLVILNHDRLTLYNDQDAAIERSIRNDNTTTANKKNQGISVGELLSLDDLRKSSSNSLRLPISPRRTLVKASSGPYVSPLQEENPWSYSLNIYPNFTFRKFKVDRDKQNLIHNDFIDATRASESGGFSMNVGLEINRRIGAITFLNSGVEYISYKSEVAYDFENFREANINSNGEIVGYKLLESSERINFADGNSYHYVNIPLSISYQPWASDHIRLNMEVGGSLLYFIGARGKTLNYQTLEIIDLSERNFKNSMGSFSIKIGANYYVSKHINIGFEPTLRYFTNTIYTEDYPFYVIPYSVGLNLNLQIKLN